MFMASSEVELRHGEGENELPSMMFDQQGLT
jgi:hypothetical protein